MNNVPKFITKCLKNNIITTAQGCKMLNMLEVEERAKNIFEWAKYYFPHKFTDDFCEELHGYLWSITDEDLTSTLAPRSHGKTIIQCFLIPIYLALHSDKYKLFFNVQNTSDKARLVNTSIRKEFENNELLVRDYGDQVSKNWNEKTFILNNGVIFSCAGAGESIRGFNVDNIRPDYIVVDDLYTEEDIGNKKRIEVLKRWFWSTLYPARANNKKCSIHVQGTAIDKDDIMHELCKQDNVKFRKFQAIINEGSENQDTLWFELEDLLKDKERMGTINFSREMQNELRDDATAIIRESWINFYDEVPASEEIIKHIFSVDPAIGKSETNDFTGKVGCYISKNHNFYIHYVDNKRYTFNENIEHIIAIHKIYDFKLLRIECIAAFKAFSQELKRRTRVPVKEISYVKDKITRKINISPFFENGKVFISNKICKKDREELVYQLINNHPKHDDISDAIILCLEEVKNNSIVGFFG